MKKSGLFDLSAAVLATKKESDRHNREIQAQALERFAREWLEGLGHLDTPSAADVICDVFLVASKIRRGEQWPI